MSADDLLPLLAFLVAHAKSTLAAKQQQKHSHHLGFGRRDLRLHAEMEFIDKFMPPFLKIAEEGYCLTTFVCAMQFCMSLAVNLDEAETGVATARQFT